MRKLARIHRQMLLTDDMSYTIASHSFRVATIGWFLAKMEKINLYKTVMMCLLHDMSEVRSNDHNWVHKKYIRVFSEEIDKEQLGTLPYSDLKNFVDEYQERKSKEAVVAKDADLLDQILLLKEYEWQGNKEAGIWLKGKRGKGSTGFKMLKTASAKRLGRAIFKENPSDWWSDIWTPKNRRH